MIIEILRQSAYSGNFDINGACGIGNMTEARNQTMDLNQMSEGYFENLTRGNTQLAELVCQSTLSDSDAK